MSWKKALKLIARGDLAIAALTLRLGGLAPVKGMGSSVSHLPGRSAMNRNLVQRIEVMTALLGALGAGCGQPETQDDHICDSSKQIDFTAFGDLKGTWVIDEAKAGVTTRLGQFEVDESGHLEVSPFGCQQFRHPLVLNDSNVHPKWPALFARSRLVKAQVRKNHARLDYIWAEESKEDKEGLLEIVRVSQGEIRVVISLPSWAVDSVFRRKYAEFSERGRSWL